MAETTFTFRLDAHLKSQFNQLARERDRNAAQVLRDFIRSFIEATPARYEDWVRAQVLEAMNDDRPPLTSAAVERRFAAKRRGAAAKAKTTRSRAR